MALSAKKEAFCRHYVKTLNGSKAARLAGYSSNLGADAVAASRLIRNDKVSERIGELLAEAIGDKDQFKNEIILTLKGILKADAMEFLEIGSDDDGKPIVYLKDMEGVDTLAIQEISNQYNGIKVKMYSKLEAAEKLMKYFEMFKEIDAESKPTKIIVQIEHI